MVEIVTKLHYRLGQPKATVRPVPEDMKRGYALPPSLRVKHCSRLSYNIQRSYSVGYDLLPLDTGGGFRVP